MDGKKKYRNQIWKRLLTVILAVSLLFSYETVNAAGLVSYSDDVSADPGEAVSGETAESFAVSEDEEAVDVTDLWSDTENMDGLAGPKDAEAEEVIATGEDAESDDVMETVLELPEDLPVSGEESLSENPFSVLELPEDGAGQPYLYEEDAILYLGEEERVLDGWGEIEEEDQLLFASYGNVPKGIWASGIKETEYSGKAVEFPLKVYDENRLLTEDIDYQVSYQNNIVAATADDTAAPTVIITGKGNYEGEIRSKFTIKPVSLQSKDILSEDIYAPYTGEEIIPILDLCYKEMPMVNKEDYIFEIRSVKNVPKEAVDVGTYNLVVTGINNYTGTRTVKLYITDAILITNVTFTPIEPQEYRGSAIRPQLELYNENRLLKAGTDYVADYKDNVNAGTATVKITGRGKYAGIRTETFEILGIPMSDITIYDLNDSYYYTGQEIKPAARLVYSKMEGTTSPSTIIKEKVDYTVTYENNKNVGLATVTFEGKGKYTGTIIKTFQIEKYDFNSEDGNLRVNSAAVVPYLKGGTVPEVVLTYYGRTLVENRDYTLKYLNNKAAEKKDMQPTVVITGMGDYVGEIRRNFVISPQDINNLEIYAPDKVYVKEIKDRKDIYYRSIPEIYDKNGNLLRSGRDFKVIKYEYKNSTLLENGMLRQAGDKISSMDKIPIGTQLLVTVEGIGNYNGTSVAEFKIVKYDLKRAKVKIGVQYYTGSEIKPDKNQIIVKIGSKILCDTDYEIVEYYNNINKGKAKIRIHGLGNYGGYATGTFTIKIRNIKGNHIYFNGNGATAGKMSDITLNSFETSCVLHPNTFSRKGYEFNGWNTREDGTGVSYADCDVYNLSPDKNGLSIMLYAQWKPCVYQITYFLNGGINNSANPSLYYYNVREFEFLEPSWAGYDFAGWYRKPKFTKAMSDLTAGTMGDLTLYAKWKLKAPVNVVARHTGNRENEITFTEVAGATYYAVYRTPDLNKAPVMIGKTKSNTYVDSSASNKREYYYFVRAYSKQRELKGFSNYSKSAQVTGLN